MDFSTTRLYAARMLPRLAMLAILASGCQDAGTSTVDASPTNDGTPIDLDAADGDGGLDPDAGAVPGPWRVVVGGVGACALHDDGRVKCWGGILGNEVNNFFGDGPNEMGANLPVINLGAGRTAKDLTVGSDHACVLLDNDRVKCWGNNQYGQLGLGDMRERGRAVGDMGDALPYVDLGTGRTVRAVSAGNWVTCAILDNDELKCWGLNGAGALGLGDMVRRGGAAGQMGDALPAVDLGTGRHAAQIFAGESRVCAILDNAALKCWGSNFSGALGQGQNTTHIGVTAGQMGDALAPIELGTGQTAIAIAHGGDTICATLADHRVKCWGRNREGELAIGDALDRGDNPNEMGDALPFADLGAPIVAIAGAAGHACAVFASGELACWGSNYAGSLGLGLADNASVGTMPSEVGANLPRVSLAGPVATVAATGIETCATLTDGRIQCWGLNSLGHLGIGDTRNRGNDLADMGTNLPFVDLGP